jgi:hypothetical protein
MFNCEKAKVHGELVAEIGKGVVTNGIKLGVEFELKNSKVRSSEIKVVVHVNKVACP